LIGSPVRNFQMSLPLGEKAYKLSSYAPTYIVPSFPIAGDDPNNT
jgi:hypothetical protein